MFTNCNIYLRQSHNTDGILTTEPDIPITKLATCMKSLTCLPKLNLILDVMLIDGQM